MNLPEWKVVSYFTPDYRESADRLEKSLQKFNISYELTPMPPFKNWLEGVRFKPSFMRLVLEKEKAERPIIFLDSDAEVCKYPALFDSLHTDFACHFRNDKRYVNECLSGTLFFRNTEASKRLITTWLEIQKKDDGIWDQRSLQKAVELSHSFSMYRLPPNYTQIFDTMTYAGEPVILHHQASRGKDKTAQAVNMIR